ncbi:MAG: AMP-binding protein [Abditibacteriota bacterium]|nr:AMP-binding protein [Abditibacteriota bacterium]
MISRYLKRADFDSYEDFVENFEVIVPDNFNFAFDVVDYYAEHCPEKRAMVWCDDRGNEETVNFGELKARSNKAANALVAAGIEKGDMVMVILGRRIEYWYVITGLHKIGAVPIPATHMLKTADLEYRNNAAGVKMIIALDNDALLDAVDECEAASPTLEKKMLIRCSRPGWLNLNDMMDEASDVFDRPTGDKAVKNDDPMVVYFTSGTSGMPKMLIHDFVYPRGHIQTAKFWQNAENDGLHFTVADTGWAKAAWGKMYGQWICGSAVMIYDYSDRFDGAKTLEVLANHKVNTFCAPATVYRMMAREDITKYDLSSLHYCVVAGESMQPEVFDKVKNDLGIEIREAFGQTETTVSIAHYPWMKVKPGTLGKPSPEYDVDLIDEDGKSVPVGEEGQIVYRTNKRVPVGMFKGYYRNEEQTKETWRDGIYYTGDIATMDEDGYLTYVGRADAIIKTSGYKVGPYEVENALAGHPAVFESVVTGVPDPIRGKIIKASIVLKDGFKAGEDLVKEIQDHVKKITAPYKYPRIIEFVKEIPKTISGKIKRWKQ